MQTSSDIQTSSRAAFPPGPAHRAFGVGHLFHLQRDFLGFLELMATYGDVSYSPLVYMRLYLLNHPDLVHEMLVTHADKFQKWQVQKKVIGQVLGNGLLNSDGEYWKKQRKLVQPSFHFKRVQGYLETMVAETRHLLTSWQSGREYDMGIEMPKVTLAIITKTMFGTDVYGLENDVRDALTTCLTTETEQMLALVRLPAWLPTPDHVAFQHAIKTFDGIIYGFIRERRASGADTGDLLSMLLLAADEDHGGTMTDKEVRDEALTLFSAGHETTANMLAWTWWQLSQNPAIEARLTEEVRRVLGDQPPTLQSLREMPYLEQVLKESMRLHPPAFSQIREAAEDVHIGGYTIPKKSLVTVSQHTLHRDPRFWEQPGTFDPERFSAEREKSIPRYAYFPFGGGPRVCPGQALAMLEAQVILAMMIQHGAYKLVPGQTITPQIAIVQRPANGLRMVVEARA